MEYMPGPAGGSGGGGFGGGSRGSGGTGGFGGGYHHHHYHRPYGGFFFFPWHRPYYGYGGGCLGGLLSLFLLPVILLLLAGIFVFVSISELVVAIANGGVVQYNERAFGDYADAQYAAAFSEYEETYEDNLLIVFTTTEDSDGYYTIVWAGDNITNEINYMFAENREYGVSLDKNINVSDYKYALDKNLAMVIDDMATAISRYEPFIEPSTGEKAPSRVINNDETLSFTTATVQKSLDKFTEKTQIPIVLVIEDEEAVFGKTFPTGTVVFGLISLGIMVFAVVWIVKSVKAKKEASNRTENSSGDYNDPRYWN